MNDLNWVALTTQGRAKSPYVPWSDAELELLLVLEQERGLARKTAADFIRNGVTTLAEYDSVKEKGFEPKKLEEAPALLEKEAKKVLKGVKKGKK